MENSELIKNFERIRDYLRQFYIYGFHSRQQVGLKSPRSYDNERRRIESWLGTHMSFRWEESQKQFSLRMNSRTLEHNPLYNAFKAKSFTDRDISLHFYVLDRLSPGRSLTLMELVDEIEQVYLSRLSQQEPLDVSTLRKKLKEYAALGLVQIRRRGKEYVYSRSEDRVDLESWSQALDFFSESAPLGVIGSFLLDRLPPQESMFRFKHHYLIHTLDSQILFQLTEAMGSHLWTELTLHGMYRKTERRQLVYPCRIHISAQTGRQYLLALSSQQKFCFFRLDSIHKVNPAEAEPCHEDMTARLRDFSKNLWGVSLRGQDQPAHLEMVLRAEDSEPFILQRLLREKRNGTVTPLDDHTFLYQTDVYDAREMLPWLRTFIGRIEKLECSDETVTQRFFADLDAMADFYGGD